jgi:hypothetical protein
MVLETRASIQKNCSHLLRVGPLGQRSQIVVFFLN